MPEVYPVLAYAERLFGPIGQSGTPGWIHEIGGKSVQIVTFPSKPSADADTLCTLAVSHHILAMGAGRVRQEYFVCCQKSFVGNVMAGLLAWIAQDAITNHRALRVGQLIGPAGPILPGSALVGFVCVPPVESEETGVCEDTDPETQFLQLVPITAPEAKDLERVCWIEMLEQWRDRGVNLLDMRRPG